MVLEHVVESVMGADNGVEEDIVISEVHDFLHGEFSASVGRLIGYLKEAFHLLSPQRATDVSERPFAELKSPTMTASANPSKSLTRVEMSPTAKEHHMSSSPSLRDDRFVGLGQQHQLGSGPSTSHSSGFPAFDTSPSLNRLHTATFLNKSSSHSGGLGGGSARLTRVLDQIKASTPVGRLVTSQGPSPSSRQKLPPGLYRLDHPKIKGTLRIEGGRILGGELEMKFNKWTRGGIFKTTVCRPYPLDQALLSLKSVQASLALLHPWIPFVGNATKSFGRDSPYSSIPRSRRLHYQRRQVQEAHALLKTIIDKVRDACRWLEVPIAATLFPGVNPYPPVTNPALPSELVMEFSIYRAQLVFAVYVVSYTLQTTKSLTTNYPEDGKLVGATIAYRDSVVEVLEHARITVNLPDLESALVSLSCALEEAQYTREQCAAYLKATAA